MYRISIVRPARIVTFVALAATMLLARPAAAQTFTNGTFDSDASSWTLADGPGAGCGTGSPGGVTWKSTVGNPAGSVQLNACGEGNSDPTAAQVVSGLTIGATYKVCFDIRLHVDADPGLVTGKSFGVLLDNEPGSPIYSGEFLDAAWHHVVAQFTATATSHTILFAAELDARTLGVLGPGASTDKSYYIDNITFCPVSVPSPANSHCTGTVTPGPRGSCCYDVVVRDQDNIPIPGSVVRIDFGSCPVTLCANQPAGVHVSGNGVMAVTGADGSAHICVCGKFTGPCTAKIYADGVQICTVDFPGTCGDPDPNCSTCPCVIPISNDGTVCFNVAVCNLSGPISGCVVTVAFSSCATTSPANKTCITNSHGIATFCICGSVTPPCTATITAGGVTLCTVPVVSAVPHVPTAIFTAGLDGPNGTLLEGTNPDLGGGTWANIDGDDHTLSYGPFGGVSDPGPNLRNRHCLVGSLLNTPFSMTPGPNPAAGGLAAYDVLHLQVAMANIASNPAANVLESSRVDLVTNLGTGAFIGLGEIGTGGNWGANGVSGTSPVKSTVSTKLSGDFLLDLYLDPNDVFGDGPYYNALLKVRPTNGPLTKGNSGSFPGHIDGLSCSTTIYRVDLIGNVDDEVRFDNLTLETTRFNPKVLFGASWCPECTGLAAGSNIVGSAPWVGGLAWVQGGLQSGQFLVADTSGVQDAGPNSRFSNSWVTSNLIQPIDLSTLAPYEGLHLRATMANIAPNPATNPFESSRVDLLTNTSGGFISLGELGTDHNWGANSFAGDSLETVFPTTEAGQRQLDLYLDPNDAAGDGPSPNAYVQVDGGALVSGKIEGLSSDASAPTVISAVRLVRNVDDEVSFDDILLETTVEPLPAGTVDVEPRPLREAARAFAVPNPFRAITEIRFDLGETTDVEVGVYDLAGRRLRSLMAGRFGPGAQSVRWDGRDANGRSAGTGVYFVRTRAGKQVLNTRVVLIR